MQVKLLRVLQEGAVRPLGSAAETAVDVRVIAATNRELEKLVAEGTFREDLYYRLSVIPIHVPPLRERREDVPLLANHFLKKYAPAAGKSILRIAPDCVRALCAYDWPGNVRQLENTIERAVALATGNELVVELPVERGHTRAAAAGANGSGASVSVPSDGMDMEGYVADIERALIQSALKQCNGVQTRAAEMLKVSYRSFRHLLKKYDL
jgi:two-component system response regulator PilR (NtrC family)